jgi:hypothetical protein
VESEGEMGCGGEKREKREKNREKREIFCGKKFQWEASIIIIPCSFVPCHVFFQPDFSDFFFNGSVTTPRFHMPHLVCASRAR